MPGDIISFRYPSKGRQLMHTLLVDGKGIPYQKKDGTKSVHLTGLKIESRNIPTIYPHLLVTNLEKLGQIQMIERISTNEAIIRVEVGASISDKKVKPVFKKLLPFYKSTGMYRTYDYTVARKYTVYFEPIKIPPLVLKKLEESKID
jgi:hypothetical protein